MKRKLSKVFALVCAIAVLFTYISAAGLTGYDKAAKVRSLMDAPGAKTVFLEDGTKVTYAILPINERVGINTNYTARPVKECPYTFYPENGDFAYMTATNTGTSSMDATFLYNGGDEYNEIITPGNRLHAYAEAPAGRGLDFEFLAIVSAVNSNEARFHMYIDQFWQ